MEYHWKDKTVIVTGGANGIGAAIIKMIADEGVKYIALLDIAEAQGKTLQDELNKKYGKNVVHFHKCDVSMEDQIEAVFKSVVKECGYLDVLINNAGMCNEILFRKEIEINYTANVSFSLKALEVMRKDEGGKGGTIISISSIAAVMPMPFNPVYCGTKSAVLLFNLSLGADDYYSRTGVRTITICVGATSTDIRKTCRSNDKLLDSKFKELLAVYPDQTPEAVAQGVSEAFKAGHSTSTWLVEDGRTKNISDAVSRAHQIINDARAN